MIHTSDENMEAEWEGTLFKSTHYQYRTAAPPNGSISPFLVPYL